MNRRFKIMLAWSLCFIMSAALINCGGGGSGGAPTVQLISISVTPANVSIPKGMTQQFTATGTYSDSSTKDLSTMVTWSSSPTAIAIISNAGLATAVEVGIATITALEPTSGETGSTTLTVTQAWQSFKSISGTGIYSDQLVIDFADGNKLYSSSSSGAAIVNYNNNSITSFLPKKSITVDPKNNSHFLAMNTGYIYESTDGGTSWNIISDTNTFGYSDTQIDLNNNYLEYSPDGNVIYCYSQRGGTIIGSPGWLFASSVDNGRTWRAPTGLRKVIGVGPIAVSNSKPDVVFARVQENLYKSIDYGLNWQLVSPPSNSTTNGDIAVDPFDHNVVYVVNYINENLPSLSMKLFKTIDGGQPGGKSLSPIMIIIKIMQSILMDI